MRLPPDMTLVDTADGSPTLAFRRADGYVERMHHAGGALSESLFIYGQALERARTFGRPIRALSVGLGLGYNELLTLSRLGDQDFIVWSFEALPFLRHEFARWAGGHEDGVLAPVYGRIAAGLGRGVRDLAGRALDDGRLRLRGSFPDEAAHGAQANLVYFDAYSNKMDPHLWAEDVLVETFTRTLDSKCVLATYAATGALNRVLKRLRFTRLEKPGFLGKRQSTLAVRGEVEC